jgi:SAM-dependent methyltransferase
MSLFGKYAQFYDAMYQDKDYAGECDFLEKAFERFSSRPIKTILNLGCGTASHDIILAKRGYNVTGVDLSGEMLKIAKDKIKSENLEIRLHKGNIQTLRLHKKFDAVICMFNVIGYQTIAMAFEKALLTAGAHLREGGLFIFDCWNRPAVLRNKPRNKIKVAYDALGEKIIRRSDCRINIREQAVEICFEVEKKSKVISRERHKVRFFSMAEITAALNKTGLEIKKIYEFPSGDSLTEDSWQAAIVSRKS